MDSVTPLLLPLTFLFVPAIAAAIIGGLLADPLLKLLIRLKSRQTVSKFVPEHAAKQGTPTMGGLIVACGFLAGIVYTVYQLRGQPNTPGLRYYWAIAALFLLFAMIGFTDDYAVPRLMEGKRGLGWMQKLVLEGIGAYVFIAALDRPIPVAQQVAGIFIILFFCNAYNFSDGLDALAGSLLLALVIGLGVAANARLESGLYPILGALAGGISPFLWLNLPPAKVFMGDVGSLPIGAVLGAVVSTLAMPSWSVALIHSETPNFVPSSLGVAASPIVYLGLVLIAGVMLFELVPVPLQILSVKLRKKRLFPATPIHHTFQRAGWKEPKIVAMFVSVQLALSLIGGFLILSAKPPLEPPTHPHLPPTIHIAPGHQPLPKYDPDLPDVKVKS